MEKEGKILIFCKVAHVQDTKLAIIYLERARWDVNIALNNYLSDPRRDSSEEIIGRDVGEIVQNILAIELFVNQMNEEEDFFQYIKRLNLPLANHCNILNLVIVEEDLKDARQIAFLYLHPRNSVKGYLQEVLSSKKLLKLLNQHIRLFVEFQQSSNAKRAIKKFSENRMFVFAFLSKNIEKNIFLSKQESLDVLVDSIMRCLKNAQNIDSNRDLKFTEGLVSENFLDPMEESNEITQRIESLTSSEESKTYRSNSNPDPDTCLIIFSLPNETTIDRSFHLNDQIVDLYRFVKGSIKSHFEIILSSSSIHLPRQSTLRSMNITEKIIHCEVRNI